MDDNRKMKNRKCPFCGGTPEKKGGRVLAGGRFLYWIECRACRISQLGHGTEEVAWAAWNRRSDGRQPRAG